MNHFVKTRNLVMTAVLTAIIIIMAFVPFLGYIPLGFMNATIIHIPVIIGSILLGPKNGAFLGLVFGCTSLWKNTFMPNLTSFVFSPFITIGGYGGNMWSIVICLLPRILIGITAYYVYKAVMKVKIERESRRVMAFVCGGVAGSITNTLLVMNFIYFFFGSDYAAASNRAAEGLYTVILGVIFASGIPEAVIAGIMTGAITEVLFRARVV